MTKTNDEKLHDSKVKAIVDAVKTKRDAYNVVAALESDNQQEIGDMYDRAINSDAIQKLTDKFNL